MNKKFFLGMFAAAGMLLATSCSNDELIEQGSGDTATVSFTVNTEGAVASRAISDGTGATKLYYAVYDANNKLLGDLSKVSGEECNDLKTGHSIPLKLAKGQTYTVAFWAQHTDAPYYVDIDNGKFDIDINYKLDDIDDANNDEKRDAFFKTETFTVTGNEEKPITLTRPFAQVNAGADDTNAAKSAGIDVDNITSEIIIKNAATSLNVLTGEPSGETEVHYATSAHPSELLEVAGKDYTWLSMCYVLPLDKEQSTTVSAEFTFKTNGQDITLKDGLQNLPIQRNYRTNIIGSLLTNSVDFKVVIDSEFKNPDHNVDVWNGTTTEEPTLNGDTYEVANAAQWAWLGGKEIRKNIKLTGDIDFAGHEVIILYPNVVNGVLDGNGKTIRNAVYVDSKNHMAYKSGLLSFEVFEGSTYTIKNLTLENVTSENYLITNINTYGYAAALVGDLQNVTTLNVEGVTVKNSTIKGIQSVGAIVGLLSDYATLNVKNTTVEGNNFGNIAVDDESGYVCGLVGKVAGTLNIGENVVIKNNTIDAFYASKRGVTSINEVAAIRNNGKINGTATTTGNTVNKKELETADYTISTAADLAVFADNVESNPAMYTGKVVALSNDIDLAGVDFKVIGHASHAEFRGTFDGRGYTIKNLTINEPADYAEYDAVGFFGWVGNNGPGVATIKNVNFKNANVSGHKYVAIVAGYLQFGHIENCSVDDFELNCTAGTNGRDGDKCGALVGLAAPNKDYVSVKNCTVSNGTINAVRDAGQAIGCCTNADVRNAITGIVVSGVTVSGNGANINNDIIGRIN